ILVNNAGVGRAKAMLDLTEEDWDAVFAVNTKGLFFCLQSGAKSMIQQGTSGKIINLASIAGRIGRPPLTHYAASKAAVISITRSAALDLARYGITVNAMCPGIVATDLWRQLDADLTAMEGLPVGTAFQQRVAGIPLGRQQEPADVASLAAFLASSDADYVTGQAYNVCGGLVLS
ncbi:MAG: SDR family oxidoreductase, partial [Chloroflexi bacterium]|nr:SDR family oxidoreductase [Chloroflexota bacterium]